MSWYFLSVLGAVWFTACAWTAYNVGKLLPDKPWRGKGQLALLALLLPLPVVDELITYPQFAALCGKEAVMVLDTQETQGKTVWYVPPMSRPVSVGLMDTVLRQYNFVEVESGSSVYHYHTASAKGGRLIRALEDSEQTSPIMFSGSCSPKELDGLDAWHKAHGITQVARPI